MTTRDADDTRLDGLVRPPTWTNPEPRDRYHVVVIGAGTAGLVTAAGAAGLGARVALIEKHRMGGDCLNVGCVPSKGVIGAARSWHLARTAQHDFFGPATSGDGDFARALSRMRALRADLAPIDSAERFRALGVDVFFGAASFASKSSVTVNGATLRFRRAVIATGARAAAPPIPGLASVPFLTNESLFDLTERPQHLVVLGGGPVGCEMAQAFCRLGSQVTLIDRGPHILSREDADAADIVQRALTADGVRVINHATVSSVSHADGEFRLAITAAGVALEVRGDQLLVASGRAPNVESLGLDVADVRYTARGVSVSDTLRTSNPAIFACGDVCSPLQFTHAADFQARTVIQNALFFGRKKSTDLIVPWATYTSPEVAHVGHTEPSAKADGIMVHTFQVNLDDVDRAVLDGQTNGFVRIHVRAGSDTIVGATIVAEHASELLAEITLCMTNRLGLSAIGNTIHPYPTQGDALRKCADAWRKTKLTPSVRSLFHTWFRWFS